MLVFVHHAVTVLLFEHLQFSPENSQLNMTSIVYSIEARFGWRFLEKTGGAGTKAKSPRSPHLRVYFTLWNRSR